MSTVFGVSLSNGTTVTVGMRVGAVGGKRATFDRPRPGHIRGGTITAVNADGTVSVLWDETTATVNVNPSQLEPYESGLATDSELSAQISAMHQNNMFKYTMGAVTVAVAGVLIYLVTRRK